MFKQLSTKTRYYETENKQNKKTHKMLEQCQKVIKQLQSQLQYALQQNQQKDQIIKLITEQKQFYEQESKKIDQKMYPKLKQQLNFNQSLTNGLKQYNKQLTQKNLILEQQNKDLWQKCKQKDQLLKITEQNICKLQQQKYKLQKQWGQTLKCVKKKIFQIQNQNNNFDKIMEQKEFYKKRSLSKGGLTKNINSKEQKRKNLGYKGKQNLKVQEILKQLDQKLLNYDFLDMIQSKELKKQFKNYDISEENKQNISQNINIRHHDKNQLKNKKVPILKLSQLTLKEDSF